MFCDNLYYRILGIDKDASPSAIKKAYYRLAKIKHPDKGGSFEEFKAINIAYDVLRDPEKRLAYNEGKMVDEKDPTTEIEVFTDKLDAMQCIQQPTIFMCLGGPLTIQPTDIDLIVPAGLTDKSRIRFRSQHDSRISTVILHEITSHRVSKQGKDIHIRQTVPMNHILECSEIEITHPDGTQVFVSMSQIRPGSCTCIIPERGVVTPEGVGDLWVHIDVKCTSTLP